MSTALKQYVAWLFDRLIVPFEMVLRSFSWIVFLPLVIATFVVSIFLKSSFVLDVVITVKRKTVAMIARTVAAND